MAKFSWDRFKKSCNRNFMDFLGILRPRTASSMSIETRVVGSPSRIATAPMIMIRRISNRKTATGDISSAAVLLGGYFWTCFLKAW